MFQFQKGLTNSGKVLEELTKSSIFLRYFSVIFQLFPDLPKFPTSLFFQFFSPKFHFVSFSRFHRLATLFSSWGKQKPKNLFTRSERILDERGKQIFVKIFEQKWNFQKASFSSFLTCPKIHQKSCFA